MSFEKIEEFQCLSLSSPQGLSHGIFSTQFHVSHVQKCVSNIVNFEGKILQKMDLSELTTNMVFFGMSQVSKKV